MSVKPYKKNDAFIMHYVAHSALAFSYGVWLSRVAYCLIFDVIAVKKTLFIKGNKSTFPNLFVGFDRRFKNVMPYCTNACQQY